MSNLVAISADGLSKRYRIGAAVERRNTIREQIAAGLLSLVRPRRHATGTDFWALRDVSFEVSSGEVVGIIGRNGAGKSTLLKILSRITEPTSGHCVIRGRTGSLLEVGTGFHPELSGRENIYLNGAVLGMRRAEIERQFDEIVEFAEIGPFLDTPVKRYSSGMYVRLAFAVAAHLNPEILVVDEVLAVGDASFQKKCLGKMGEVAKGGRTVLFVSHNLVAVERLCTRAIRLDRGRLVDDGIPSKVIAGYLEGAFSSQTDRTWQDLATAPGNEQFRLMRATVRPENGDPDAPLTVRTPLVMEFEYWNLMPGAHLHLSVHLLNQAELTVFNTFPVHEPVWHGKPYPVGLFRSQVRIPGDMLNTGSYRIQVLAVHDHAHVAWYQDDLLTFDIQDSADARNDWNGEWVGVVRPMLEWRTEMIADDERIAVDTLMDRNEVSAK